MKDAILYRTVPVYPNEKGTYEKAGDTTVCAILLGVVSNHPLGMLGPGFQEVGDRFEAMVKEMSADATQHGFLGSSAWLNASHRTSSNEFMSILYFVDEDALHAYAHGPMHTKTMEWWHETESKHKHVGIMHEVFACPKKSWEGVYLNYHPTGKFTYALLTWLGNSVTDASDCRPWNDDQRGYRTGWQESVDEPACEGQGQDVVLQRANGKSIWRRRVGSLREDAGSRCRGVRRRLRVITDDQESVSR
jgi:hypothetical protein